jgi:hypothetical protein
MVLAVWRWKRFTVVLHSNHDREGTIGNVAPPIAEVSGAATGASKGPGAPPAPTREHTRTEESCHWFRRVAGTSMLRTSLASLLEAVAQQRLESAVEKWKRQGRVTHGHVTARVNSVIPDVSLTTSAIEETQGSDEWIDFDAHCILNANITVDVEVPLLRQWSLQVGLTVSDLRIAGARIRCYTAGPRSGDVVVDEVPSIRFELHSSIGQSGRLLQLTDCFALPYAIEYFGRRFVQKIVGRVFKDALSKMIYGALPESCK